MGKYRINAEIGLRNVIKGTIFEVLKSSVKMNGRAFLEKILADGEIEINGQCYTKRHARIAVDKTKDYLKVYIGIIGVDNIGKLTETSIKTKIENECGEISPKDLRFVDAFAKTASVYGAIKYYGASEEHYAEFVAAAREYYMGED